MASDNVFFDNYDNNRQKISPLIKKLNKANSGNHNDNKYESKEIPMKVFTRGNMLLPCHFCGKLIRHSPILGADCEVNPENIDQIIKIGHVCNGI